MGWFLEGLVFFIAAFAILTLISLALFVASVTVAMLGRGTDWVLSKWLRR